MNSIKIDTIIEYVCTTHNDVIVNHNWGERGLFYNPARQLPKGVYLLTFKEKDGPHDQASALHRGGLYRLNLGISKPSFIRLFGGIPARPPANHIVDTGHNFQQLDVVLPHPVYGWMAWISVINPSHKTFEQLKPLITEAYQLAQKKFDQRLRQAHKQRISSFSH